MVAFGKKLAAAAAEAPFDAAHYLDYESLKALLYDLQPLHLRAPVAENALSLAVAPATNAAAMPLAPLAEGETRTRGHEVFLERMDAELRKMDASVPAPAPRARPARAPGAPRSPPGAQVRPRARGRRAARGPRARGARRGGGRGRTPAGGRRRVPGGGALREPERDRGAQAPEEARQGAARAAVRGLLHGAHARHALGAQRLLGRRRAPVAPLRGARAGRGACGRPARCRRRAVVRARHDQVLGAERRPERREAGDLAPPPRARERRPRHRGRVQGLAAGELGLPRLALPGAVPRAPREAAGSRRAAAAVVRHGRAGGGLRRAEDAPRRVDGRREREGALPRPAGRRPPPAARRVRAASGPAGSRAAPRARGAAAREHQAPRADRAVTVPPHGLPAGAHERGARVHRHEPVPHQRGPARGRRPRAGAGAVVPRRGKEHPEQRPDALPLRGAGAQARAGRGRRPAGVASARAGLCGNQPVRRVHPTILH